MGSSFSEVREGVGEGERLRLRGGREERWVREVGAVEEGGRGRVKSGIFGGGCLVFVFIREMGLRVEVEVRETF